MAELKCPKCGQATSNLAVRCSHCLNPPPTRDLPGVPIPRYVRVIPYLLIAYMGSLGVPAAADALGRHNVAVEAERVAKVRAVEVARALERAEQLAVMRVRRDSVVAALPTKRLRRVSDADLRQALSIASAPTEDTVSKRWLLLAQRELARREELEQDRLAREARRAQAAQRRQALLEPRREQRTRSSVPSGASARCRDGTYSYSASRRGTCSHHGGVAVWY